MRWDVATVEERYEMVTIVLEPGGLYYDLENKIIAAIKPRPAFLPVLRMLNGIVEFDETRGLLVTDQDLRNHTGVGIMSIGRHPLRGVTNAIDGLLEKALGRFHIPLLDSAWHPPGCHRDRWRDRESTIPFDVNVGFIDILGSACLSTSFCPQLVGDERGKTGLRVSHRLMGEHTAALQEHLGQITQTQLIP